MANLAATLQALNMMLDSRDRRLSSDIQSSLAGMELALKERQRKDLKDYRDEQIRIQDRTLADQERRTASTIRLNLEQEEQLNQKSFQANMKMIRDNLAMDKKDLADDMWVGMGLDQLYMDFVGATTKPETTHRNKMIKYLSGDNVGFTQAEARQIAKYVIGYGSSTAKNPEVMLSFARQIQGNMAFSDKYQNYLTAGYNAGMWSIPELYARKKGITSKNELAKIKYANQNDLAYFGRAEKIDKLDKYLDQEIEELQFVSKLKGSAKVDEEARIKYDFNNNTYMALAELNQSTGQGAGTQKRTPPINKTATGVGSYVDDDNEDDIAYSEEEIVANAMKNVNKWQKMADKGDFSYRMSPEYFEVNQYMQPSYDKDGNISGAYVTQHLGKADKYTGIKPKFDYDMTKPERLALSQGDAYDLQTDMLASIEKEISDSRENVRRLNDEIAHYIEQANVYGVAQPQHEINARQISRFREEERLAHLEAEQSGLWEQLGKATDIPEKDRLFWGMNERGIRERLPGKYLTESERKARREEMAKHRNRTYSGGSMTSNQYIPSPMMGLEMSLEDYLGGSLEQAVEPAITPKNIVTDPKPIQPVGADSTIAPMTTPVKQDTTYSFPHSMSWFRAVQDFQYPMRNNPGISINDQYITHIDGKPVSIGKKWK